MATSNRCGGEEFQGKDCVIYLPLFNPEGDQSKAKKNLIKAIQILKECGADGWVEKYEKELAELS